MSESGRTASSGDLYTALALLDGGELDELSELDAGIECDPALGTSDEDQRLVTVSRHNLMRVKLLAKSVDRPPTQVLDELLSYGVNHPAPALDYGEDEGGDEP